MHYFPFEVSSCYEEPYIDSETSGKRRYETIHSEQQNRHLSTIWTSANFSEQAKPNPAFELVIIGLLLTCRSTRALVHHIVGTHHGQCLFFAGLIVFELLFSTISA